MFYAEVGRCGYWLLFSPPIQTSCRLFSRAVLLLAQLLRPVPLVDCCEVGVIFLDLLWPGRFLVGVFDVCPGLATC